MLAGRDNRSKSFDIHNASSKFLLKLQNRIFTFNFSQILLENIRSETYFHEKFSVIGLYDVCLCFTMCLVVAKFVKFTHLCLLH